MEKEKRKERGDKEETAVNEEKNDQGRAQVNYLLEDASATWRR